MLQKIKLGLLLIKPERIFLNYSPKPFLLKVFGATFFQKGSEKNLNTKLTIKNARALQPQSPSALCSTIKLSLLKVFGATFFQKGSEKFLTQNNFQSVQISLSIEE